ncbi:hypothetical protein BC962_0049 [Gillisia mitskevichiae]|uniref:Lipoprotein n=1 Tax=Gillisia mitskevichiae TaxID=270921 RepID=A0A495PV85_9FLAO|nr:hypothetical protein [Gillisia mitskevichiae]RKS55094.1 hypothetical protein BC962_0049 [Gillisia mitskevichiae]
MKSLLLLFLLLILTSCIPLRIAPNIKGEKLIVAKKFKRTLPRKHSYVFEDPKDANEFYNYINTKYDLGHEDVSYNVPIIINGYEYFLSFHEVEKITKTLNLIPLVIDAGLDSNGYSPLLEDMHSTRTGNWYIVLTVSDSKMNDCLDPNYGDREVVINYLKQERLEYLTTSNYFDALFKK